MQIIQYIKQWNQAKNEYNAAAEFYEKAYEHRKDVFDWNVLANPKHMSCVSHDKYICPSFQDVTKTCTKCEFFYTRMQLKKAAEDEQVAHLRFMEARNKLKRYSIVDMFKQR
ncbi:MAG: hypothetical protein MJ158_01085 [Alphaproteobacteria bacterium]|nr:hypothetical protein [Alphaproteobacteria bacterium]